MYVQLIHFRSGIRLNSSSPVLGSMAIYRRSRHFHAAKARRYMRERSCTPSITPSLTRRLLLSCSGERKLWWLAAKSQALIWLWSVLRPTKVILKELSAVNPIPKYFQPDCSTDICLKLTMTALSELYLREFLNFSNEQMIFNPNIQSQIAN